MNTRRMDPEAAGWDTEVFSEKAEAQLALLANWLEQPKGRERSVLKRILAEDFQGGGLLPDSLETVFDDGVGEDGGDPEKAALFLRRIGFPFDGAEPRQSSWTPFRLSMTSCLRRSAQCRFRPAYSSMNRGGWRLYTGALPFAGRWFSEPDAPSLQPFVSKLVEHGDFEIALEYLERHKARLLLEGGYAGLLYILGNQYHDRGLFREAEEAYRSAVRMNPVFRPAEMRIERLL